MKNMIKRLTLATLAGLVSLTAFAETIRIAYPNWAEGIAMTYLAKAVLEDELDYDVELTQADPGVIYSAVASGDQDLFLDAWLPHTHEPYWDKYQDELVDLGPNYAYGVTGLVVPAYVKIDSIDQLNSIKDDLDGKIIGIGTGAGITRNTNRAIEEYDLDLVQVNSSGPAMTAALKDAIDDHKSIVVTGWKPHWMFGRFDLKVLSDPRGVYPIDGCKTIARKGFVKDFPEVAQFLTNFNLTEAHLLDLMLKIDDSDDDVADVAEVAVRVEVLAVVGDDAGRFLPAVLQGVQAEGRQGGGVVVAEDAEDAAFLVELVVVPYPIGRGSQRIGGDHCVVSPGAVSSVIRPSMAFSISSRMPSLYVGCSVSASDFRRGETSC